MMVAIIISALTALTGLSAVFGKAGPASNGRLLEGGGYRLLEDGSYRLLES